MFLWWVATAVKYLFTDTRQFNRLGLWYKRQLLYKVPYKLKIKLNKRKYQFSKMAAIERRFMCLFLWLDNSILIFPGEYRFVSKNIWYYYHKTNVQFSKSRWDMPIAEKVSFNLSLYFSQGRPKFLWPRVNWLYRIDCSQWRQSICYDIIYDVMYGGGAKMKVNSADTAQPLLVYTLLLSINDKTFLIYFKVNSIEGWLYLGVDQGRYKNLLL